MPYFQPVIESTGWAQYLDGEYTAASPFVILDGSFVTLANNAAVNIVQHLPQGVESYYDPVSQRITPEKVGDYNLITVRFTASSSSSSTYMDFGIDIGGTQGVIFQDTRVFPKGAGIAHRFSFACPGFSLDTFVANGGAVKIGAVGGDIDVYDIGYQIARVHKP